MVSYPINYGQKSINLNILECKASKNKRFGKRRTSINLNILECKGKY